MAEAWPLRVAPSSCDFYLQKNTGRFISPLTKSVQTIDRQGRLWIARFTFRLMGRELGQQMDARLDRGDSFLMWDMRRERPLNGELTGVALNAAALRGATTLTVDGLPLSQTHLVDGDYVGINGSLYRLVADVAANGSGVGTLTLNRGLLAAAADNTAVVTLRPTCEMILADDDQASVTVDNSGLHVYTISMQELIPNAA